MAPPTAQTLALFKALQERVRFLTRLMKERLVPRLPDLFVVAQARQPTVLQKDSAHARTDRFFMDEYQAIIDEVRVEFARAYPESKTRMLARRTADDVSAFNRGQIEKVLRAAVVDVSVFRTEPWLADQLMTFVTQAVSRISTMDERYFSQVESMTARAVSSGMRHEELAKHIAERTDVTLNEAKLIARDQVGTLNGNLTMLRQTELGATTYIWRTARDHRVRGRDGGLYPKAEPSHWEREGVEFSWAKPPPDGHPGVAINCRCYAEMVPPPIGNDEE